MDREAERDVRDTADRDEIALRVVPDVGPRDGSDHEVREAAKEQRVAVGRGARDGLRADRAACPGTVFDDDANTPVLGERVGDDTRHVVGGAPGLLPGDDPDGAVGKRPGVGRAGNRGNDCRECAGEENGQEAGGSVCHRQWRIDRVRPVIRTGPHFRMAAARERRDSDIQLPIDAGRGRAPRRRAHGLAQTGADALPAVRRARDPPVSAR